MKDKKIISLLLIIIGISLYFMPSYVVKAETYNGEYSINYLLRNYSIVTLGQKDGIGFTDYYGNTFKKGDVFYNEGINATINGNVLISGNIFKSNNYSDVTLNVESNSETIKSYIKGTVGTNVEVLNQVTDSNYLDFQKMYEEVVKESKTIADNTNYYINDKKLEVSKPGTYTIQNTASLKRIDNYNNRNNSLLIKNYDKNSLYIFNYYNEFVYTNTLPTIMIMENGSSNAIYLSDYINSGNYTGNIIFNFPNAKQIDIQYVDQYYGFYFSCYNNNLQKCEGINANIIAPNADVYITNGYFYNDNSFYGSIISNSLRMGVGIKKTNYTPNKKIVKSTSYMVNANDFNDDFYSRDYSIKDLLENYSLVTLGHKAISSNAKLSGLTDKNGSIRLFHITGQALINGDVVYDEDGFVTAFDLQSNKVTESYINGRGSIRVPSYIDGINPNGGYTVIQPWDNMDSDNTQYTYQKNSLFIENGYTSLYPDSITNAQGIYTSTIHNYINFDRLYNNVVTEQKAINEGTKLKVGEDGIVHIPIGGCYYIEDISKVKEVVFDNFGENKDKLTIVTVKNEGNINFPLISKDTGSYKGIVTNDYYGKESATHLYERDTFIQDSYYGNIVWNAPNATYIKLKENAPFAGHLIAPNADVDTPETHFAGCFIVNSIYGEGNTEAHFYPITVKLDCDCAEYRNLSDDMKERFSEYRLKKLLGGDASTIETSIIGDEIQYKNDVSTLEHVLSKCPSSDGSANSIVNILKNPPTSGTIGVVLLILIGLIGFSIYKKNKKVV